MITINTIAELEKIRKDLIIEETETHIKYSCKDINFSEKYRKEELKRVIEIEIKEILEKNFKKITIKIIDKLLEYSKNEFEHDYRIKEFKKCIFSADFECFLNSTLERSFQAIKSSLKTGFINKKKNKYIKIEVVSFLCEYLYINKLKRNQIYQDFLNFDY